jgi:O-antigen/teichoic acid export membrane protein
MRIVRTISSRLLTGMPRWAPHWVRDTRLLLFSQILVVVATTALVAILARTLGPSDWGLFSALFGFSLAVSTFVDLGLGTWLLRELSKLHSDQTTREDRDHESSERIMGTLTVNLGFGCVLVVGASIVLAITGIQFTTALALIGLLTYTVFVTTSNCLEAFFRAERRLRRVVAAVLLEKALLLTLAGGGALLGFGMATVSLGYLCAGLVRLGFVGFTLFVGDRLPARRPTILRVRRTVTAGLPFAISTVGFTVIPRLDVVLIAPISAVAAGYFALGERTLGPLLMVPAVAGATLYPFLAREVEASSAAWRISGAMAALGLVATIVGAALAPVLVPQLFGQLYVDAVRVVQVMLLVVPFVYASSSLLTRLFTSGREREVLVVTVVASLVGTGVIVAGQLLIGPAGAAAGYVLRQALFTLTLGGMVLFESRAWRPTEDALMSPGRPAGDSSIDGVL